MTSLRARKSRRHSTTDGIEPAAGSARLVAVSGSRIGCKFPVEKFATIGRATDCDVVIDDAECSRHHAEIKRTDAGYVVSDLGSRNGTIVNGVRINDAHALSFGDRLRIGPKDVFLFSPHDPVEEQLLHRQRLETLGRLTAGAAHDLNNMLGAVKASVAYIQGLDKADRGSKEADACLEDVSAAAARAADLAGRLLSFARANPDQGSNNLSNAAHEAFLLARRTFERSVNMTEDITPDACVEVDNTQIHQVIMNLLVNARDAVGGRGSIQLIVRTPDERTVILEVRDDGCGLGEAERSQIFEPFYTTKRPGSGFGLGLSTVAEIVRAHHGDIRVRSEVNGGSVFTVTLPRAVEAPSVRTVSDATDAIEEQSGGGLRVVLVDDEPVMRRSLSRVLRRSGFRVLTCESGEQLLEGLEADGNPPQAIVLDLDLPGITGEETLRQLRQRGFPIPVVCISGHHNPSRQQAVEQHGAAAFVGKPFEPEELITELLNAVRSPENADQLSTANGLR